ncbi:hypothetical protein B0T14DRAFT_571795 [Immersiella caudata]|uniref:FAD-binding domain-containing protein n=1 Tax=Immersiella caudata TaxID=314043 RepID=A0AA39W4L8_9PEZI|nr:hypothetical protein B0T14DRAFT_571795 [Immersiella caudata]
MPPRPPLGLEIGTLASAEHSPRSRASSSPELHACLRAVQAETAYEPNADAVMPLINGITDELLRALETPSALRLKRGSLVGVDRYGRGRSSVQFSEGGLVEAAFADGAIESGNLVIGAEGAHSVINPTYYMTLGHTELDGLGERWVPLSLSLYPFSVPTFDHSATESPTHSSGHSYSSPNPEDWTFVVLLTWHADEETGLKTDKEILDDMRSRVQHLAYPFKESVTAIPRGTKCWHAKLTYWPTKPWNRRGGRVTLVGDAARAMTFHRGQGLGNTVTDAVELLKRPKEMKEQTPAELAKAVQEYENEVWPRGHEAVMANLENTIFLHNWETVMQSAAIVAGVKREGDKIGTD